MIITLPRESLKYLDDEIVRIEIDEKHLNKELNYNAVKNTKGLLKKYKIDPEKYQNKIREEWDRDFGIK